MPLIIPLFALYFAPYISNSAPYGNVDSMLTLFLPKALQPHLAQTVRDGTSSPKIDHVAQVWNLLNLEGQQNCFFG